MAFFRELTRVWSQLPTAGKFGRDVFWNYLGLAVLAASGMFINGGIARFYGPEELGIFNLVFATYLVLSQIAVLGVHLSVQKHVAQHSGGSAEIGAIVSSGLSLVTVTAGLVCSAALALSTPYGLLFGSPDAAHGLVVALPGLFFFALNKVQLSVLNGFRRMKLFAFCQALRYLLMLAFLAAEIAAGVPGAALPSIFSGTEAVVFVVLFAGTRPLYAWASPPRWCGWWARHAVFGSRALLGGILIDANTKIDVLMLGIFRDNRVVGIYSLAAMVFEGFGQLGVVIRDNMNPVLARLSGDGTAAEMKTVIRRVMRIFYLCMGCAGCAAVAVYPLFLRCLIGRPEFSASWPVFAILMAGLILSAGYRPLDMLLVQIGRPGLHTWYIGLAALSNVALNAVMIPFWGMYGAAVATAASYCFAVFVLKRLVVRSLGIRI